MLLFPQKSKYKKHQKGKSSFKGFESTSFFPKNGFFGLKILKTTRIKSNQIEAARKVIRKRIKKKYRLQPRSNVFPDRVATRKSSGIRMGKGKGNLDYWYATVGEGRVIFELGRLLPKGIAFKALKAASWKFSNGGKVFMKFTNVE